MQRTHAKQTSVGASEGVSVPPADARCRATNTEETISSSFPRKRESSKTSSFTGFPLPRERRKGPLKQMLIGCQMGDSAPPPAARCRAANAEGSITSSFPRKRESSKTSSFTEFPLPRERRKGSLKLMLIGCLMEDSASPPLWERRESRRRAPARHFCGPFAEGVASQPFAACAAPTEECSGAHSREANKRRCHRRRFRHASGSAPSRS
jgi:hypothetical protein